MKTVLFALWFLVSSVRVMSAGEPSPIPKHFIARLGYSTGRQCYVELQDGILNYEFSYRGLSYRNPETITPTEAQWREFRKALDDLNVWQWRPAYEKEEMSRGCYWSVDIAYSDRALKVRGRDSYPDAVGKPEGDPEYTEAFNRFLKAINKLVGRIVFR